MYCDFFLLESKYFILNKGTSASMWVCPYTVNFTKTVLESIPPLDESRWLEESEVENLSSSWYMIWYDMIWYDMVWCDMIWPEKERLWYNIYMFLLLSIIFWDCTIIITFSLPFSIFLLVPVIVWTSCVSSTWGAAAGPLTSLPTKNQRRSVTLQLSGFAWTKTSTLLTHHSGDLTSACSNVSPIHFL